MPKFSGIDNLPLPASTDPFFISYCYVIIHLSARPSPPFTRRDGFGTGNPTRTRTLTISETYFFKCSIGVTHHSHRDRPFVKKVICTCHAIYADEMPLSSPLLLLLTCKIMRESPYLISLLV